MVYSICSSTLLAPTVPMCHMAGLAFHTCWDTLAPPMWPPSSHSLILPTLSLFSSLAKGLFGTIADAETGRGGHAGIYFHQPALRLLQVEDPFQAQSDILVWQKGWITVHRLERQDPALALFPPLLSQLARYPNTIPALWLFSLPFSCPLWSLGKLRIPMLPPQYLLLH